MFALANTTAGDGTGVGFGVGRAEEGRGVFILSFGSLVGELVETFGVGADDTPAAELIPSSISLAWLVELVESLFGLPAFAAPGPPDLKALDLLVSSFDCCFADLKALALLFSSFDFCFADFDDDLPDFVLPPDLPALDLLFFPFD